MVRFFRCKILQSPRRVYAVFLAFALLLGIVLGSICSGFAEPVLFLLMRTAAESRVSIVCLLPVMLLPIFLSALAVSFHLDWLLIPMAFLKAFFFGYLCAGILTRYSSSGWLFALLFLFADILSLPVLCWYWLQCIRCREAVMGATAPAVLSILGIGILNDQLVSPFLASLLS